MTAKAAKDVLKKEWIRTGDIKVYFGCSDGKACQIMKEIKAFQDSTGGFMPYGRFKGVDSAQQG